MSSRYETLGQGAVPSTRPLRRVVITSSDAAASLEVISDTYAPVASGVGALDIKVPSGEYQVQQRIGSSELIQEFTVGDLCETELQLDPLSFSSPIPLPANNLSDSGEQARALLAAAEGNCRLLLWSPLGNTPQDEVAAHLESQWARLHLIDFRSGQRYDFDRAPMQHLDDSSLAMSGSVELASGSYLLVQALDDDRQRCMSIWIAKDYVTALYMLALQRPGGTQPSELAHAAMVILPAANLSQERILTQMEAARKSLATAGRQPVVAWDAMHMEFSVDQAPLLYLMRAQFVTSVTGASFQGDLAQLSALFGAGFPDTIALEASKAKDTGTDLPAFTGPPLLMCSWRSLLNDRRANTRLQELMDFPYQLEGGGAWFSWIESKNSHLDWHGENIWRHTLLESARDFSPILFKRVQTLRDRFLNRDGEDGRLQGLLHKLAEVAIVPAAAERETESAGAVQERDAFSLSDDEKGLLGFVAAFVQESGLRKLFVKARLSMRSRPPAIRQAVDQLISALQVLRDPTLIEAVGRQQLFKDALASLELPQDKTRKTIRALVMILLEVASKDELDKALHWFEEKQGGKGPSP